MNTTKGTSVLAVALFTLVALLSSVSGGCDKNEDASQQPQKQRATSETGTEKQPATPDPGTAAREEKPKTVQTQEQKDVTPNEADDYCTITLWMVNWHNLKSSADFQKVSVKLLAQHAMADARKSSGVILLHTDDYHVENGKRGTMLRLTGNWSDPLRIFCNTRGDFPSVKVRDGSLALAENSLSVEIGEGTQIRIGEACFIRKNGKWIPHDTEPFISHEDTKRLGEEDFVKARFKTAAGANAKDIEGYSVLQKACEVGGLWTVKYLVENGADVNYVRQKTSTQAAGGFNVSAMEYKETPLSVALANKRWKEAALLIQHGADVDLCAKTVDYAGVIVLQAEILPLNFAARFGQADLVQLILKTTANVDSTDSEGNTPLIEATEGNHADVVKLLLRARANIDRQNNKGVSALHIAQERKLEAIKQLLDSTRKSSSE